MHSGSNPPYGSPSEMEMERLRLRDEVEGLQMQLASLEGETPRAFNDDNLRRALPRLNASSCGRCMSGAPLGCILFRLLRAYQPSIMTSLAPLKSSYAPRGQAHVVT